MGDGSRALRYLRADVSGAERKHIQAEESESLEEAKAASQKMSFNLIFLNSRSRIITFY